MPRLMSMTLTTRQVRNREKSVTRRLNWRHLRVGEVITLCEKVRGRKLGEELVRLANVTVTSVTREPLENITDADVAAEGFPNWSRAEFIKFFCETHPPATPSTVVTRIEWQYEPETKSGEAR